MLWKQMGADSRWKLYHVAHIMLIYAVHIVVTQWMHATHENFMFCRIHAAYKTASQRADTQELLGPFQGYKNQSQENKSINITKIKYYWN